MDLTTMTLQLLQVSTIVVTQIARKSTVIQMSLFVAFQPREVLGRVSAMLANERLFIEMDSSVRFHMVLVFEFLLAKITAVGSDIGVSLGMLPQLHLCSHLFTALVAGIQFIVEVHCLMNEFALHG